MEFANSSLQREKHWSPFYFCCCNITKEEMQMSDRQATKQWTRVRVEEKQKNYSVGETLLTVIVMLTERGEQEEERWVCVCTAAHCHTTCG